MMKFFRRVINLLYSFDRQVETEILDSVMGPAVYDSRIRPSGINGTGRKTSFSFYVQQWGIESNLFTTSSFNIFHLNIF